MATIVIAPAETISAVEIPPLSIPLRTYAVDHDRAERAEPSETMQASPAAGIRNRVADGRSTRVVTRTESNESSSGSSQTLTPSSFENSDEDQGNFLTDDDRLFLNKVLQTLVGWCRLPPSHGETCSMRSHEAYSLDAQKRRSRSTMPNMDTINSSSTPVCKSTPII
jgi:hypothetical protein